MRPGNDGRGANSTASADMRWKKILRRLPEPILREGRWVSLALNPSYKDLLRRLPRRDDLLRGLAGEFGHVVELEGEGANAGGGRTYLDDEVADLGLRHQRAHRVPAGPAFAGVEAENLPAPAGQDRVDLRGRVSRAHDLHLMDRLQQHRIALRQRLDDADAAGGAERHVGGVDGVIGAIDQRHRDVDHGKTERAFLERVDHTFLDRGDVVAR